MKSIWSASSRLASVAFFGGAAVGLVVLVVDAGDGPENQPTPYGCQQSGRGLCDRLGNEPIEWPWCLGQERSRCLWLLLGALVLGNRDIDGLHKNSKPRAGRGG